MHPVRRRPHRQPKPIGSLREVALARRKSTDIVAEAPISIPLTTTPSTAWDPAALLTAKVMADQGDLTMVGDLWESMLADDRCSAAMEQRCQGLEGLPLVFEGEDDGIAEALDEDFWSMSSPGVRSQLRSWSLGVGVGVAYAKEWVTAKSGRQVPVLQVWKPRWLRRWLRPDGSGWDWWIQTSRGVVRLADEPGRWFLCTPGAAEDSSPWLTGLWYSTATWWLAKTYGIADMGLFGQSHVTPKWILRGKDGVNVSRAIKAEAIAWLSQIISRSGIYVPPGFELSQEETNSYAWQVYPEQVKLANRALASRILGQHLTTDEAGGAGAAGDEALRQDLIESDADSEAAFWHDGPLVYWTRINFGAEADVPWPKRDVVPPSDKKATSEAALNASNALSTLEQVPSAAGQVDVRKFLGAYFPLVDESEAPRIDTPAPRNKRLSTVSLAVVPDRRRHSVEAAGYADMLVEELGKSNPEAMGDIAGEILRQMSLAGGYAEARLRLAAMFPRLDASRLRQLMSGALLMAQAAGRASVGFEGES